MRILLVAHVHPRLSAGGAHFAAWNTYLTLRAAGEDAHFLAFSPPKPQSSGERRLLHLDSTNHVLELGDYDYFWNLSSDFAGIDRASELVADLAPDVVNFHHFLHIGWNGVQAIARAARPAKVMLTFHEYLLLCYNHGQMIKTRTAELCSQADALSCGRCFPNVPELHFLKRQVASLDSLSCVDLFTAPSHFLMRRLIGFGLPEERCLVLENLLDSATVAEAQSLLAEPVERAPDDKVRVAFFGRLTENKGVHVFLAAIDAVARSELADKIVFHIWGDMSGQPKEEQDRIAEALRTVKDQAVFHGPYDNRDATRLMRTVDYVVVPSIWWENAPLVIQEAFLVGVPVIASNIGGMREKVQDGVNGLHFEVGDARDLVRKLALAVQPEVRARLSSGARAAGEQRVTIDDYLDVYRRLAAGPPSVPIGWPAAGRVHSRIEGELLERSRTY